MSAYPEHIGTGQYRSAQRKIRARAKRITRKAVRRALKASEEASWKPHYRGYFL